MSYLPEHVIKAEAARRYMVIWDRTGQVFSYFRFKHRYHETFKDKVAVVSNLKTKEEALHGMRNELIISMFNGKVICYNFDKVAVDLWDDFTHPDIFPSDKIFDYEGWRKSFLKNLTAEEKQAPEGSEADWEFKIDS